jgi:hypothetical protein
MVNTVTGEVFWPSCAAERSYSVFRRFLHVRTCGPEGLHFEAGGPVQFRWETPPDVADD